MVRALERIFGVGASTVYYFAKPHTIHRSRRLSQAHTLPTICTFYFGVIDLTQL